MTYPNNDLWSVRQIEFLQDALKGYEGRTADFEVSTHVKSVEEIAKEIISKLGWL